MVGLPLVVGTEVPVLSFRGERVGLVAKVVPLASPSQVRLPLGGWGGLSKKSDYHHKVVSSES